MQMHRTVKFALAVTGILAVVGGGIWYNRSSPVRVTVADPISDQPIEVFALGTVEARVVTRLGFRLAGTIVELAADHGDLVAAGTRLARIDSREQEARTARAKAGIASAEAALAVAEAAANRASVVYAQRQQTNQRRQALLVRGAVSIEQAEEAQLNETTAQADTLVTTSDVAAARARLGDARAQAGFEAVVLSQHDLLAPFAGLVVGRTKELGSVVAPGEPVFMLVDPATYWILAYLDEGRSGSVTEGQHATIRLRSLPGRVFRGRVARIGLESDRVNEERRIFITCDDCPSTFVLGEQSEVVVRTGMIQRGLFVPEMAIDGLVHDRGDVWAVADRRLVRRSVTLGGRTLDGRYEILSGLDGALPVTGPVKGASVGRAAIATSGDGS
ncbi:efflux RND transporter periplasmic adaptor subunit [Alsobacter sp. R-9]